MFRSGAVNGFQSVGFRVLCLVDESSVPPLSPSPLWPAVAREPVVVSPVGPRACELLRGGWRLSASAPLPLKKKKREGLAARTPARPPHTSGGSKRRPGEVGVYSIRLNSTTGIYALIRAVNSDPRGCALIWTLAELS